MSSSSLLLLLFVISSRGCLLLVLDFLTPAALAPNTDGARLVVVAVVALLLGRPGRRLAGAFSVDAMMIDGYGGGPGGKCGVCSAVCRPAQVDGLGEIQM